MSHELHYLVTVDDIARLNHYHNQRSPWLKRRRVALGLAIGMMGLGIFMLIGASVASIFVLMFSLFNALWIIAGQRQVSRKQLTYIRRLFSEGENRALFGPHQIVLHEDRVEVITPYSRTEFKWEAVERVEQDETHIYVYVSALNAHVIPKQYFTSELEAQRFFQQAAHLRERAHHRLLYAAPGSPAGFLEGAPSRPAPRHAPHPAPRPEPRFGPAGPRPSAPTGAFGGPDTDGSL